LVSPYSVRYKTISFRFIEDYAVHSQKRCRYRTYVFTKGGFTIKIRRKNYPANLKCPHMPVSTSPQLTSSYQLSANSNSPLSWRGDLRKRFVPIAIEIFIGGCGVHDKKNSSCIWQEEFSDIVSP